MKKYFFAFVATMLLIPSLSLAVESNARPKGTSSLLRALPAVQPMYSRGVQKYGPTYVKFQSEVKQEEMQMPTTFPPKRMPMSEEYMEEGMKMPASGKMIEMPMNADDRAYVVPGMNEDFIDEGNNKEVNEKVRQLEKDLKEIEKQIQELQKKAHDIMKRIRDARKDYVEREDRAIPEEKMEEKDRPIRIPYGDDGLEETCQNFPPPNFCIGGVKDIIRMGIDENGCVRYACAKGEEDMEEKKEVDDHQEPMWEEEKPELVPAPQFPAKNIQAQRPSILQSGNRTFDLRTLQQSLIPSSDLDKVRSNQNDARKRLLRYRNIR